MARRSTPLVVAVTVASAAVYGLVVGPYWVFDAISFAALALVIAMYFMPRFRQSSPGLGMFMGRGFVLRHSRKTQNYYGEARPRPPTSRVLHYVRLAKMRDPKFMTSQATGPFEKKLLRSKGWQQMSEEELRELAGSSAEPARP